MSSQSVLKDIEECKEKFDKKDLSTWVDEYGDYLFRYAFRYFRDETISDEIVQETFLAAVESLARFEGRSSPRTWLTAILKHKILDRLRMKTREVPIDMTPSESDTLSRYFDSQEHWLTERGPVVWTNDPSSVVSQKQFVAIVENCLSKLPNSVREIFLLREIGGYSRDEIADEMSRTGTNIGVILHRARLWLQECLQIHWFKKGEEI